MYAWSRRVTHRHPEPPRHKPYCELGCATLRRSGLFTTTTTAFSSPPLTRHGSQWRGVSAPDARAGCIRRVRISSCLRIGYVNIPPLKELPEAIFAEVSTF
jgi:hypothetical protein